MLWLNRHEPQKNIFDAILCSGFIFEILLENHYFSPDQDVFHNFEQAREVTTSSREGFWFSLFNRFFDFFIVLGCFLNLMSNLKLVQKILDFQKSLQKDLI